MRALDQAPSIKDLNIEKRFCNLKNFNEGCNNDDDDNDDDNNNNNNNNNNNIGQTSGGNLPPSNHHFHLHRQFHQWLL